MNIFERKMFYFNDPRFLYSINDIKVLVAKGVTPLDAIIHIDEIQSYRVGDVAVHKAPRWALLDSMLYELPTLSEPAAVLVSEPMPQE